MTVTEAINCQELVELVTDYLEGALSTADLRRFEEPSAGCGKCTEYLAQLERDDPRDRHADAGRPLAGGRTGAARGVSIVASGVAEALNTGLKSSG